MHIDVAPGRCQGHSLCAMEAPDVFDIDDEGHVEVLVDDVPGDLQAAARTAILICPVQALAEAPQ